MLYSREKWCHSSRQSYQTVPDIMSLFHKNRTKGLKRRAIKAQTDYRKDMLLATSPKLKTVKTGLMNLAKNHLCFLCRDGTADCYRSCCCLYHPMKTKTKCTYWWLWTSSMTASLLQKLNHFYTRWAWSMWEVTLWQKNKSSQGLIHTVNLNCSKHMCMCVCVCMCTNWENECHQPFYSRQKLDSFPIISKSK